MGNRKKTRSPKKAKAGARKTRTSPKRKAAARKTGSRKQANAAARNRGIPFEQTVAELQKEFGPEATITHNERLKDRHGHLRQFDVVLRGKIAGHDVLGVIECKDTAEKVGTPDVDAFVTKTASLRADIKIMVSRHGFTQPAIELAVHHGIRPRSLLKTPAEAKGVTVGTYLYARRMRWGTFRWGMVRGDGSPLVIDAPLDHTTLDGRPLWPWLVNEFYSSLESLAVDEGLHRVTVQCVRPLPFVVASQTVEIVGLKLVARRYVECFRRPGWIEGRAFVGYSPDMLHLPKGASIETRFSVDAAMTGWERIDSIPAELPQPFPMILNLCDQPATLPAITSSLADLVTTTVTRDFEQEQIEGKADYRPREDKHFFANVRVRLAYPD